MVFCNVTSTMNCAGTHSLVETRSSSVRRQTQNSHSFCVLAANLKSDQDKVASFFFDCNLANIWQALSESYPSTI